MNRLPNQRAQVLIFAAIAVVAAGVVVLANQGRRPLTQAAPETKGVELSSQSRGQPRYIPTSAQRATLTLETVAPQVFRSEHLTEGKIAINEDSSTPIFSPYAGRVTKLAAKPGEMVERGQPLFFIEAADMVQAQNDFAAAVAGVTKARSRVTITELIEKQNRSLHESRAGSLRDFQQAQADLAQANSELRTSEAALDAARNRLTILGKTDDEIAAFQDRGRMSPETPIYSPISGTVVQRKVGPGQYVSYTSTGSVDPVFTIGDLSTVWLVAYIRETEAPKVRVGQQLDFTVLAYPDKVFSANITYVASSLDPNTRRLLVRATIDNSSSTFKPEMFASVTIFTEQGAPTASVSREAVIFEADSARVWVMRDDNSIELRQIKTGAGTSKTIQVLDGLKPGEKVVAKGSLFVDRAAGS